MTHGFDVVSIRANNESTIVVWVVLRPQTWRPVVFAASRKCRSVELPDLLPILRSKGDVDGAGTAAERTEPEVAFSLSAHHCPTLALHRDSDVEGLERLDKKFLRPRKVRDVEPNVIKNHK